VLDYVGLPSVQVGFSKGGGEYHTSCDDTQMMERFLGPATWATRRPPG
jgi:hypothetical protein